MTMTTIKVPAELRDRINADARQRGVTAAGLIEHLLEAEESRRRMEAFGRAFASADDSYREEFHAWDRTLAAPATDSASVAHDDVDGGAR